MMRKENFVKAINALIEQSERDCEFEKALEPFFDNYLISSLSDHLQNAVIDLLEDEMNDIGETISWWLYDAPEAGKNKESCYIFLQDGTEITVETPEQLYDFLTASKSRSKIDELKNVWLQELARRILKDDFIEVVEDSITDYEQKFKCNFYTEDNRYRITAINRKFHDYLGCTVTKRKPMAGKDYTRGNDLPDGPLTYDTWQNIKNGVVAYELVPLHRPIRFPDVAEDE